MKVGTDGVILGGWTDIESADKILDVGTGTGLIALMLAQRSTAQIDAVEIDRDSHTQACENVARSPWEARVKLYNISIQDYAIASPERYDLIVSNPPFFDNAYKAPKKARSLARHGDFLSQSDLLSAAETLLKSAGKLAVIYPTSEAIQFLEKAEKLGFFCYRRLSIKPTPNHPVKRIAMELGMSPKIVEDISLTIERERHIYTDDFIALIRDFYLKY